MKLKYKLFLCLFPLFAFVLVALFGYLSMREKSERRARIETFFANISAAVQTLLTRQEEGLKVNLALLSRDPAWGSVSASTGAEGMSQVLGSIQEKSSIELLVFVGPDGEPREGSFASAALEDLKAGFQGFFHRSGELKKRTGYLVLQGKLFQVALAPLSLPGQSGFLVAGTSASISSILRAFPGSDVAISSRGGHWSGSALSDSGDQLKLTNLGEDIELTQLSSGAHLARALKLDPDTPTVRVALLAPANLFEGDGQGLAVLLLSSLVATCLVSALISWWLSRSIAGPLDLVTKSAREMGSGGTMAAAPSYLAERSDEVGLVASSFNVLGKAHQDELKQKEKALAKLEKYQAQLLDLNHRLAKKLYENRVMLMLWKEQEKAADTKDFLSHILEEVLQGLPFEYGCIIIRPLAQIGPEVILARIERTRSGKDEISVTDILERSDRTLWLSSLSAELKDFLLKMNHESGPDLRLLQETLTASIEPEGAVRNLKVVSLRLAQGNQHMGSLHLIAESGKAVLNASDEEFLLSVAAQVSVALDNRALQLTTRVDALTRLYNRGYMDDRLREEMMRTSRTHRPFTLMILDIDHFKKVNDTHGHPAGDEVLVGVSALLKRSCRASDAICRYGGEEIAIVLADTPLSGAKIFAENLRKTIETESFSIPDGKTIRITASMGLAEFPSQAGSMQELIKHADDALYRAKREGRNVWRAFTA
jgi:diguanylate cyclase (GGDEF)-like protein